MEEETSIKVGITQGDINGIGYEVILKCLQDGYVYDICTPIVYGSPKIAAYHRKALNISNFNFNNAKNPDEILLQKPNLINCIDDNFRVELGKPTQLSGLAAFRSIELAVQDLVDNKIDVLVTAPICKHNIQSSDFSFPGHTEYLAEKAGSQTDGLMLMIGETIKVGVVTGHVPLRKVADLITMENILDKIRILDKSLTMDFGHKGGKIAVLGLNPHAGDDGLLGNEEKDIIIPAIEKAQAEGINVFGPYPADGLFSGDRVYKFDAVLAMYHDQGLAPFKALEFENGINYTAGLSFIRTSPAHGTAFEIAGQDKASPNSFRQALYTACEIFRKRNEYKILTSNVLPKYSNLEEDR